MKYEVCTIKITRGGRGRLAKNIFVHGGLSFLRIFNADTLFKVGGYDAATIPLDYLLPPVRFTGTGEAKRRRRPMASHNQEETTTRILQI